MVSQVDLILQNYDLGGTFRGKLLKVRQYTVQMQQLITEVLDFRRLEQGENASSSCKPAEPGRFHASAIRFIQGLCRDEPDPVQVGNDG